MLGIVDYSSEDDEQPAKKKRKLPPLPASLASRAPVDDPGKHQGRIRTKAHVDGQFAALILVPLRLDASIRKLLSEIIDDAQKKVPEIQPGDISDLHISLSRTLYLRRHQREELLKTVKNIASQFECFKISFAAFDVLCNDERTRAFLTMEIGAGHRELQSLAESLQPKLELLRQDAYYSEPRFHVSICWTLLNVSPVNGHGNWHKDLVEFLETKYGEVVRRRMVFTVDEIQTKIGKKETIFQLKDE